MATTVSTRAIIRFDSDQGDVVRISIPRANVAKTTQEAEITMQAMIDNGIIITGAGIPISIKDAALITVERERIM